MTFEAIVFDNDGLLLDTEEAWTRAETALFARYGKEFTAEHKRELIGTSGQESHAKMERMLGQPGRAGTLDAELHELVMEELLAGIAPRPGALELLDAVRGAGIPVGLATNSSRAFLERALMSAGLTDGNFDVMVSAEQVAAGKPAPDIYLAVCAALGAAPERAAALEDSPTGVAAARAAGMFVIAVPYFPDMPVEGASLTASSLAHPTVAAALGLELGA
jgi:HAD superfamily hydrolase (TIGR01509 family)